MGALRKLQTLETELLEKLAPIYGCDADDLEVELDLLHIYNLEESQRLAALVSIAQFYPDFAKNLLLIQLFSVPVCDRCFSQQEVFAAAPGDVSAILDQLLVDLVAVSSLPK
jgi:hypothetical protein